MRNPTTGVLTGFVREIDEANSQVKLEFPNLPVSYRSNWAPIAHPLSGPERGMYYLPEEGDEALVAFLNGDFDTPYVVGFLWNGGARPPETDRKNRVIKTPGGHTLRFEDTDNAKKIVLKSDGGAHLTIDDTARTITVSDSEGANKVVIQASGTVTVQAAAQVVVQAPQIALTSGAAHPVVFGDLLLSYLNAMVMLLKTHTHLVLGVIPAIPSLELQALEPYLPANNSSRVKTG